MRALVPHPSSDAPTVTSVRAQLWQVAPRTLRLRYELQATAGGCEWPPPAAAPARRDGLWQHSCCELFLHAGGTPEYLEYNLAPCGDWAAYAFAGYRERAAGSLQAALIAAPRIQAGSAGNGDLLWLEAEVELPVALLPGARAGLCVVVESAPAHALSYWALAHPRARPDFHDAAGHLLAIDPHSAQGIPA